MTKKTSILIASIAIVIIIIVGVTVAVVMAGNNKPVRMEDDNFIYTRTGDKVVLTKYKNPKAETKVELPLEIDGYKVSEIDANAFKGDESIVEVIIPAGYTIIGESAFEGCTKLENVTLTDVSLINANAFKGCEKLMNINVNERLAVIGDNAFDGCKRLTKLNYDYDAKYIVRSNLSEIGNEAFKDTGLGYIVIPKTMKSIGKNAFNNASLSSIFFYEGIEVIGEEAFKDASNTSMYIYTFDETKTTDGSITDEKNMLKLLSNEDTFPNSLKEIGDRAFMKTSGKSGTNYFDDMVFSTNLKRIGREAFMGTYMTSVKFLNKDTTIDAYAFSYLRSRIEAVLPENLTTISEGLFLGTTLTRVDSFDKPFIIPSKVETIGIGAFSGGINRYKLQFSEASPAYQKYSFMITDRVNYLLSKDGKTLYAAIASDPYDNSIVYNVPEGVEVIERNAFVNVGNTNSSLVLPTTIKTIKQGAMNDLRISAVTLKHTGDMDINIEKDAFMVTRNVDMKEYFIIADETSNAYKKLYSQFADDELVHVSILTNDKEVKEQA